MLHAAISPPVARAHRGPYSDRTNHDLVDEHPGIFIESMYSFWRWEQTRAKVKIVKDRGRGVNWKPEEQLYTLIAFVI